MSITVMKQALDALESRCGTNADERKELIPALRAAIKEAESVEPVAFQFQGCDGEWHPFINQQHYTNTVADGLCPIRALYPAPPAARPAKSLDILMVTTAYEQGVGKGHQAHNLRIETPCPYAAGKCSEAWEIGYQEGKKQAVPKVPLAIKEQP